MYKVISHQISEQHFDSPVAAAHGMATYCGGTYGNVGNVTPARTPSLWYHDVEILLQDPETNNNPGYSGSIAVSSQYVYLCIKQDTWIRWPYESGWGQPLAPVQPAKGS